MPNRTLEQRLSAAYRSLEIIEHGIRQLAFLTTQPYPALWDSVRGQAAQALGDLARAPSLTLAADTPPSVPTLALAEEQTVLNELTGLAESVVLVLVEASADATDVADHRACLVGAIRVCALQQQLELAAVTFTAEQDATHHARPEQLQGEP